TIANGDVPSLIAAIHTADGNGQDNTIVLAGGGSYVLTAVDNTTDGPTGLPVIATGGHTLTIQGNRAALARSTAAGTPAFRLLDVAAGSVLDVVKLTLADGLETGAQAQGGGIFSQGNVTLTKTVVRDNVAQGSAGATGQPGAAGGQAAAHKAAASTRREA